MAKVRRIIRSSVPCNIGMGFFFTWYPSGDPLHLTRFRVPAGKFDWREEMAPCRSLNAAHRRAPTECQIAKDCPASKVRQDR